MGQDDRISSAHRSRVFSKWGRASHLVLVLMMASTALAQPDSLADMFPLNKGNQWTYVFNVRWVQKYYGENDIGTATYSVIGSTFLGDGVTWHFRMNRDFMRSKYTMTGWTAPLRVSDTSYFDILERLNDQHELFCPSYDWTIPYHFTGCSLPPFPRFFSPEANGSVRMTHYTPKCTTWIIDTLEMRRDTGIVSTNGVTGVGANGSYYFGYSLNSFTRSPYSGPHLVHATGVSLTALAGIRKDTTIYMENDGIDSLVIASISSTDPDLDVSLSSAGIRPYHRVAMYLKYASASAGPKDIKVIVVSNAVSSPDTIGVSLTNAILGKMRLGLRTIYIPNSVKLYRYRDTSVVMTNVGSGRLTLDSTRGSMPEFRALVDTLTLEPGESRTITIRYTSDAPHLDRAYGQILFFSNGIHSPDTLDVSGNAAGATFYLDRHEVDFGTVRIGTSADSIVRARYSGSGATIGLQRGDPSVPVFTALKRDFLVICRNCGILPDTIRFTPQQEGPVTGFVVYTSLSGTLTAPDTVWLKGTGTYVSGVRDEDLPVSYQLDQNYPNPFNPSTTIRYGLPIHASVTLRVYDVLGRQVALLENGVRNAGYHEVRFDGAGLPSGVYLYRLQSGAYTETKRLLLLK